jgi:hypothetical protein
MLETSRPVTSLGPDVPMTNPRGQWRYHRRHAYRDALQCPGAKGRPKVIKIRDGTDVAARYLVYKLYDAAGGQPMQWHVLQGMGGSAATISRAVERGWVRHIRTFLKANRPAAAAMEQRAAAD